jgi:hypothetical protein
MSFVTVSGVRHERRLRRRCTTQSCTNLHPTSYVNGNYSPSTLETDNTSLLASEILTDIDLYLSSK